MKSHCLSFLAAAAFIILPHVGQSASAEDGSTAPDASAPAAKQVVLSTGLDEVVDLVRSGVEESVVVDFIRNSDVPYKATARDIIELRDRGVSPKVMSALLNRGREVREQAPPAPPKEAPVRSMIRPASAPEPVTVYYAPPRYSSPTVIYTGSTYGYPVRSYGYAGYCSPGYYRPSYYNSCYSRAGFYGGYSSAFSVGVGFGGYYGSGYRGGYRHCR